MSKEAVAVASTGIGIGLTRAPQYTVQFAGVVIAALSLVVGAVIAGLKLRESRLARLELKLATDEARRGNDLKEREINAESTNSTTTEKEGSES